MNTSIKLFFVIYFIPIVLLALGKGTKPGDGKLEQLKQEAIKAIDQRKDQAQQINDMLFSYADLFFQKVESLNYLTSLL